MAAPPQALMPSRLLAIGDIHGHFAALRTLEDQVPIGPDDRIVSLGDYVDRGPDSRSVVEWFIARERLGNLIPLRGNHELMMLAARTSPGDCRAWLMYGGDQTLASYAPAGKEGLLDDVPAEHWNFIEHRCRDWFETETHLFVHAGVDPDLPLSDQPAESLFWNKLRDPRPHRSGKIMICGHTPQKSGLPLHLGHAICIDTWVYGDGWLTCLDVATGTCWQANKAGDFREIAAAKE